VTPSLSPCFAVFIILTTFCPFLSFITGHLPASKVSSVRREFGLPWSFFYFYHPEQFLPHSLVFNI
jgi:hypothetical protein